MEYKRGGLYALAGFVWFLAWSVPTNVWSLDPSLACSYLHLKAAAKYSSCHLKAIGQAEKTGSEDPETAKCTATFQKKWSGAYAKYGGASCVGSASGAPEISVLGDGADAFREGVLSIGQNKDAIIIQNLPPLGNDFCQHDEATGNFTVQISNAGVNTIHNTRVRVRYTKYVSFGVSYPTYCESPPIKLRPFEVVTVNQWTNGTGGDVHCSLWEDCHFTSDCAFTIEVDSRNTVNETNENNNTALGWCVG